MEMLFVYHTEMPIGILITNWIPHMLYQLRSIEITRYKLLKWIVTKVLDWNQHTFSSKSEMLRKSITVLCMRSETLQRAIIVQYFAKIAIFVIHFLNFISAYYFCGDEIIFGNHEIPT